MICLKIITETPFYYIHNKEITSEAENILTDLQDPHSVIVSFFTIFTKICVIFWDERFKLICRIFFLQLLSAILVFSWNSHSHAHITDSVTVTCALTKLRRRPNHKMNVLTIYSWLKLFKQVTTRTENPRTRTTDITFIFATRSKFSNHFQEAMVMSSWSFIVSIFFWTDSRDCINDFFRRRAFLALSLSEWIALWIVRFSVSI